MDMAFVRLPESRFGESGQVRSHSLYCPPEGVLSFTLQCILNGNHVNLPSEPVVKFTVGFHLSPCPWHPTQSQTPSWHSADAPRISLKTSWGWVNACCSASPAWLPFCRAPSTSAHGLSETKVILEAGAQRSPP